MNRTHLSASLCIALVCAGHAACAAAPSGTVAVPQTATATATPVPPTKNPIPPPPKASPDVEKIITAMNNASTWGHPDLFGEFAGARLYSEVLLQCFWVVMLVAGWWRWLRHLDATGHVRVAPLQRRAAGLHLLAGVAGGLALGFAMHRYTNAALPWLDAMLTALSLVGQFWQNRRHVAAWWMWIAVDVVYVGMFATKHLFVTAVLYVGFVTLAVKGLRDWTRAAATAAATPAAD